MLFTPDKPLSLKILIIYMVGALLFLSSIELHIHTKEAAVSAEHGAAVSITAIPDTYISFESSDEIAVSPEGMLHAGHINLPVLAIFLLLTLIVPSKTAASAPPLITHSSLTKLPFYGTPSLRAPPQ